MNGSLLYISNVSNTAPFELNFNDPDSIIIKTEELKIGIDQIRDLKKQIAIKPIGQIKTVTILEAEKLTLEAQNALLKTLEEPPENTQVILVASKADLLLPTVLSRCQIINLPNKKEKSSTAILPDNLASDFAWAKKFTDRKAALEEIDQLIINAVPSPVIRRLLKAKKYLQANTNVRLTLENIFLDW